jgi:hydrogenase-4 component F
MGFILWIVPLVAVALSQFAKSTKILHIIGIGTSLLMLVIAGFCTSVVMTTGELTYSFFNGLFLIDSLSIIILDIVTLIYFLTSIYGIGYLQEEVHHGKISKDKLRLYYMLMYIFLFAMVLALTVSNIGIIWVAIEATTLASAFLVGFQNDHNSLEAAWKYIIICSVGIAITLVGIIFLHLSSVEVIQSGDALKWNVLLDEAGNLNQPVLRFAFFFILIGFGTKAGLAPMHTWLPDAHSQAPSPISALLSGVLLNSAMYAIIRCLTIVNKSNGDSQFAGRIMIGFGLLSVITAAIFILSQKDYKRLLAYSSIEHMGIIALAIGLFTPLSIFAGLLHMMNHSLTKSMLFLASGNILQKYNAREISKIQGLLKVLPITGTIFLLGLLAISGTPPFSIFSSEVNVFISIFDADQPWLGVVLILLLAVIFAGIAATLFKVFFGTVDRNEIPSGETNLPGVLAMGVLLIAIIVTGVYMPAGLKDLFLAAQQIVLGG